MARRICTICDDISDRDKRLMELNKFLSHRHYPTPMINAGIEKAKAHDINELRQASSQDEDQNIITFVHTYNPHHPNMFRVIHDSKSLLEGSPTMKDLINNTKIISSKRATPKS